MVLGEVPLTADSSELISGEKEVNFVSELASLLFYVGLDTEANISNSARKTPDLCKAVACCRAAKLDPNLFTVDVADVISIERDLESKLTSLLSVMTSQERGEVMGDMLKTSLENGFVNSLASRVFLEMSQESLAFANILGTSDEM